MKKVYRIKDNGFVLGLWGDELSGLGEAEVHRASKVEFDQNKQAWTVTMISGPVGLSCLAKLFPKRADALEAEVEYLNETKLL